jgi:ribose 5-phosphate isomerase B
MNIIDTIYLSADHAGYDLKEQVKNYLSGIKEKLNTNYQVVDFGAFHKDEKDNYTDIMHDMAHTLANKLKNGENDVAFVFGGSGEGEGILMNRYGGIRAITYYGGDINIIRLGREHNNANCISFGARFVSFEEATRCISLFLNVRFEGGRHIRRVRDIDKKINIL